MNLCRKYCHPARRSLTAIGSRRFCSSNSAAQSYQICHSEERSDVGISCNSPRIRRGFPTIRLCTAEIAASACGLLAMTNLKALHQ